MVMNIHVRRRSMNVKNKQIHVSFCSVLTGGRDSRKPGVLDLLQAKGAPLIIAKFRCGTRFVLMSIMIDDSSSKCG